MLPTYIDRLPAINACFNALSATLLLLGYISVRRRNIVVHRTCMVSAFISSSLFLVGYLIRMANTGSHRFPDAGLIKTAYLILLFSHMVLAIVLVPLVLRTLYLAYQKRFTQHRRMARYTFPIWMYVSVTGVMVYAMLYHVAPTL